MTLVSTFCALVAAVFAATTGAEPWTTLQQAHMENVGSVVVSSTGGYVRNNANPYYIFELVWCKREYITNL